MKILLAAALAASSLVMTAAPASAQPHGMGRDHGHMMVHRPMHHRHQVCTIRHHHRVCAWR